MDPSQPPGRSPEDALALDKTLAALPPHETLRPQTRAELQRLAGLPSSSPWAAWQEGLPRLSLGPPAAAGPGPSTGADLQVRGTLGEGGMGRVLLAWQRSLGREVAVKTLKGQGAPDEARMMLLLEGRTAGSLEHPGIVPVHALGVSEHGEPLLVTKRIDGTSWRELLRDPLHPMLRLLPGGREDPLQAHLFILTQVCNAVHFAHSRGVLHRDIKPDNVMVGGFGEVYLLDWGVAARLPAEGELRTAAGELVGTPVYMAPEMVSAEVGPLDARTDVYLLGATLHEVLTGTPRHPGDNAAQVLLAALSSAPCAYGAEVPAELAAICQRATSGAREARPASALALRQAIETFLRHRGAAQAVADARERLSELRRILGAKGTDQAAVQRLTVECRFALQLALREWPESPEAQAGLAECITLLCEEALAQRRAAEARGLLAELLAPPPELAARVAALEAELREEQARAEALRRMAQDQDQRIGARPRLLLGAAVLCGDLAIRRFITGFGTVPTIGQLLRANGIIMVVCVLGVLIGRRYLLANAFSRRFLLTLASLLSMLMLHRLMALTLGVPVTQVLRTDLFIIAVALLTASVTLHAMLLPLALMPLVGLLASVWAPAHIGDIFPMTLEALLLGGMLLHYLTAARREVSSRSPGTG